MLHAIAERDWKVLHQLREIALDRFCQRVLSEIGRLASEPDKSSHERYLAVFKLIERRDKELANAFDNPSRSKGLLQLACMQALDLLTEEECRALAWTPARQFSCWEVNRSLYATAPCWRGVPMIKYPAFVAWHVKCASPVETRRIAQFARNEVGLDNIMERTRRAFPKGVERDAVRRAQTRRVL